MPTGEYQVILVNQANLFRVQDYVATSPLAYGPYEQYPHRWWFDEYYKYAMAIPPEGICSGLQGNCGPQRLETWKHIWDGFVHQGWTTAWLKYWRDHDHRASRTEQRRRVRLLPCELQPRHRASFRRHRWSRPRPARTAKAA
jgi:hypothetical protein